ncbi:hypothetical protein [Pyruvatibacter mobilis]|uniref:hypothetical protein n=1 Tax=Pyruvatibacter mobilis TaxID=1712261 RepID=UPI003BAC0B63
MGKSSKSSSSSSNTTSTNVTTTNQAFDYRVAAAEKGFAVGAGASDVVIENLSDEVAEEIFLFGRDLFSGIAAFGEDVAGQTFALADQVIQQSRSDSEKIANRALVVAGVMVVAVAGFMALGGKVKFA